MPRRAFLRVHNVFFALFVSSRFSFVANHREPHSTGRPPSLACGKKEHALVHGAGQIGLLAALALFGVDYFTSYFYATGEMMQVLHSYGLEHWGYTAAAVIAVANISFGALYMYSLGIFNEGGGAYTASMRYLKPGLSLVVAVVLIQDYVLTIVVSALSGGDQLLSILNLYGKYWWLHFLIGATLAGITYWLTIRPPSAGADIYPDYFEQRSLCNRSLTCACISGGNAPSSRRSRVLVAVIRRCSWSVDETRNPVAAKPGSLSSMNRSVSSRYSGTRLVMNARTMWPCGPIGSVRHTAGRTLLLERLSKGKGTRKTLYFIHCLPV
jgi:hypothetical protein